MPEFEGLRESVGKRLWEPRGASSGPQSEASLQHAVPAAHGVDHVPPPSREAALQLFSIYFGESDGAFGVGHAQEGEHRRNRGRDVISAIEYLHSAKEAVEIAREGGGRFQLAGEGPLSVGQTLMSPLAIVNGVGEAMDGIEEYKEATRAGDAGGRGRAGVSIASGAAGATSGLAPLLGWPGVGQVAGSFAVGVGIGKYGSQAVKEMGWLKDEDGKALTPSEWATQKGLDADEMIDEMTHGMFGREGKLNSVAPMFGPLGLAMSKCAEYAGPLTTVAASFAGAGTAVMGAGVKGAQELAHLITDSGATDVIMHPDRYREVAGTPAQEAMKHLAKYGAPSDRAGTP